MRNMETKSVIDAKATACLAATEARELGKSPVNADSP
jgi:hypothetical protein